MQRSKDLFCQVIVTIKIYTMKRLKLPIGIIVLYCLLCFAQCKKSNPDSNGLPAATQDGKNTLGFLLNGQPWKPQGSNGTANLSIDFDAGFNNGVCGISAYRIISSNNREYFKLGIIDSLNFYTAPFTIPLTNSGLALFYFSDNNCLLISTESGTNVTGNLSVSKLDRINRIIAGTFSATLSKTGCPEIKITDGRFDMKF